MEPIIREEFSDRTGFKVKEVKAILQHKRFPFMLANLDGIVTDPERGEGIFEAKTANAYAAAEWEAGIPDAYSLQVQHYMAVTGLNFAYIAVLIGGNKFLWKYIERDEGTIDLLIQLEARFWKYVQSNTPPPIDGSKASKRHFCKAGLHSVSACSNRIHLLRVLDTMRQPTSVPAVA